MMSPGHPEHGLLGIASLAIPEAWQHMVNHGMDVILAFSGLSLVLGYGVLILALPLLLLPTAFPELSRPRDGLWSLVLAALAPLLLLNRLPVFSSAGLGQLIATVVMARLAAEVGQGRWKSLTPDQRAALRHLPRWRSAGNDLVAAVVQAAKATWRAAAQMAKAARLAALGQQGSVHRTQHGQDGSTPVRKQWVRPDSSDEVQADQEGETSPELPDVVPAAGTGTGPDNVLAAEPAQPVDGGESDVGDDQGADAAPGGTAPEPVESDAEPLEPVAQPSEGVAATAVDHGPDAGEESAPQPVKPVESPQPTQPVDGGEQRGAGDAQGADAGPGGTAPGPVESDAEPLEPVAQPSEGVAVTAVDHGPDAGEIASEEPNAPQPAETTESTQPIQTIAGTDNLDVKAADASFQAAENSTPLDVVLDDDPGNVADAGEGDEGFVATRADPAGATEEMTDDSGAKAKPSQPAGDASTSPIKDWQDVVVSGFDDVDQELWSSTNWSTKS